MVVTTTTTNQGNTLDLVCCVCLCVCMCFCWHCSLSSNFHYLITCRRQCDGNKNNVCLIYPVCNTTITTTPTHTSPIANNRKKRVAPASRPKDANQVADFKKSARPPLINLKEEKIISSLSLSRRIFICLAFSLSSNRLVLVFFSLP